MSRTKCQVSSERVGRESVADHQSIWHKGQSRAKGWSQEYRGPLAIIWHKGQYGQRLVARASRTTGIKSNTGEVGSEGIAESWRKGQYGQKVGSKGIAESWHKGQSRAKGWSREYRGPLAIIWHEGQYGQRLVARELRTTGIKSNTGKVGSEGIAESWRKGQYGQKVGSKGIAESWHKDQFGQKVGRARDRGPPAMARSLLGIT